jgi:hypothetical protein
MPDDTNEPTPPQQPHEQHTTSPPDRQSVELGEHVRKGTDVFPPVTMSTDQSQPLLPVEGPQAQAEPPPSPPVVSDE